MGYKNVGYIIIAAAFFKFIESLNPNQSSVTCVVFAESGYNNLENKIHFSFKENLLKICTTQGELLSNELIKAMETRAENTYIFDTEILYIWEFLLNPHIILEQSYAIVSL